MSQHIADKTNGGVIAPEHVEGAIAFAQQHFRSYASELSPLYSGLNRDGIVAVYSEGLHEASYKGFAESVASEKTSKTRNTSVAEFARKRVFSMAEL